MTNFEEQFKSKILTKFNGNIILDDIYINAKTNIYVKSTCGHRWSINPSNLLSRGTGGECIVCFGKNVGKNKLWSKLELDILKSNYDNMSNPEIQKLLPNRTINSIFNKAKELNLKKSDGFFHNTLEEVNTRIQSKYPELKLLSYTDASSNTSIIQNTICGHSWNVTTSSILTHGTQITCRTCNPSINSKRNISEITNKLQAINSDISCVEYTGRHSISTVRCNICGLTWDTIVGNVFQHKYGHICKSCHPTVVGSSIEEKNLLDFIRINYDGWIIENDTKNLEGQELDIVLPDLGLAFEYNGVYWHSEKFKDKNYHLNKTNTLKENIGYKLIHINSDEWKNKQNIVKSRILSLLGKTNRIFARKCVVKEILFPRDFLNENHIQGCGSPCSINLGLFFNNELVATMTFSKPRFTNDYDYELVRYCSKLNFTIIGGASKLFTYFNNNFIGSIVSYSDKRWSVGELYKKLGFEYSHTSEPNYRYYKGITSLSRYQCQKHKLKDLLPDIYSDNKTESEIMLEAGYYKVYDCGNDVWVY